MDEFEELAAETGESVTEAAELPEEPGIAAEGTAAAEDTADMAAVQDQPSGNDTAQETPAEEAAPEESSTDEAETESPGPGEPVRGTAYSDPFFNIPPVLGAMNGLDRETFWQEVTDVRPRRRRPSAAVVILAVLMLIVMVFAFITAINGRGWLIKLINGGKNFEFTLPAADKPQLESSKYQADGRYTIEGLTEAVSQSVVALEIYSSKPALLPSSQGSGIIMTEDGYIVTNAHVVEDAAKIKVVLYNREEFSASVVGSDEATDIAVIKIGAGGLQPAEYGNSDQVALGEDVVAIGSPAGFYGSVTKGIISGLDRLIKVESFSMPMHCIQVDAAINPGNSGGALFDMGGQVIGITSSKLSSTKYDGIGFAISINDARPVIERLLALGYIADRPLIGISFYPISEETAVMAQSKAGLLIAEIKEDCDIANTELAEGDIITSINGKPVSSTDDVKALLDTMVPGETVTSHVYRPNEDGTGTEFDITYKLARDEGSFVPKKG